MQYKIVRDENTELIKLPKCLKEHASNFGERVAENMVAAGAGAVFRRIPVVGGIVAPIAAQVKHTSQPPCSIVFEELDSY